MKEVILVVRLQAKPGMEYQLEKELSALVVPSCQESGCILYALHRDINHHSVFVLVERWASQKALDMHMASEGFQKCMPIISSLLATGLEMMYLDPLVPSGPENSRLRA